jgi:hypothetical protein
VSYVEPTVWTVRLSLRDLDVLTGTGSAGLDNYRSVLDAGFGRQVAFALSLAVAPLLVALVVAPLVAYAIDRGGPLHRRVARAVLALPLALYAPVGVAAAWQLSTSGPDPEQTGVRTWTWLLTAGGVCALATTGYLMALRAANRTAVIATGAVAGLAVVAGSLQAFSYPLVLGAGGEGPETVDTPVLAQYLDAFGFQQGATAAAIGTLTLALLAPLGVGAAVVLIAFRIRLDVAAAPAPAPGPARSGRLLPAAIATGLLVVAVFASHGPWLAELGPIGPNGVSTLLYTWVPTLVSSAVAVGLAALAAYGIGALRPLGRWSELLLLPFAPWLFVGPAPLAPRTLSTGGSAGPTVGADLWTLVPPTWLAVPALFLLTALFAGLTARPPLAALVAALPMIGLAFIATWIIQAQDIVWPLASGVSDDHAPAPLAVWAAIRDGAAEAPIGATGPVPIVLVLLAAAVLAQVLYLDRVSMRVGAPGRIER